MFHIKKGVLILLLTSCTFGDSIDVSFDDLPATFSYALCTSLHFVQLQFSLLVSLIRGVISELSQECKVISADFCRTF